MAAVRKTVTDKVLAGQRMSFKTKEVEKVTSTGSKKVTVICHEGQEQEDNLGYEQELYRGFSPLAAFAFCFTSVSVIPSLSTGLMTAVGLGGPAEIIWAWLVCGFLSIVSGAAMAELASTYPQSGSVYFWAGQLATKEWAPVCAYITGWANAFGNLAGDAAFAASFAGCIASCVTIVNPEQEISVGGQVGISIAVHAVWTVINLLRNDIMGWINNLGTFVQLGGTSAIIIVLFAMSAEKASGKFVFTQGWDCTGYEPMPEASADSAEAGAMLTALAANLSNLTTNLTSNLTDLTGVEGAGDLASAGPACSTKVSSYTIVLGMITAVYAFVGYEAGSQIAEETQNAAKAAPWGIMGTVMCCFVFGTVYLLSFLFATPDITQLADPFTETFTIAAGQQGGLALMIILVLMFFFAGVGATGASSRIIFALARDAAIPMHHHLDQVWGVSFVPLNALIFVLFFETLLLLLPLVNESALVSVTGSCSAAYCLSYAIPFVLRMTSGRAFYRPALFDLRCFSLPCHFISACFNILAFIVLLWPTVLPVDKDNMNWTVVVLGSVVFTSIVYWFTRARKFYVGPKRLDEQETIATASGIQGI